MTANPDLLDLSQLQRELQASEGRRHALMGVALDCIICADEQLTITDFNPAAERTFRIAKADALGKDLVNTILPLSLRNRLRLELFTPITGDINVVGNRRETRCMRSDGSHFPAEITVTQVTIEKQASYAIYVRDITARRMAEEELVRLASIVESSRDAIFSVDLAGHIISWNKGAELIYGYSRAEALTRDVFSFVPPEHMAESRRVLGELQTGRSVENFETIRVAKNGRRIEVSRRSLPSLIQMAL